MYNSLKTERAHNINQDIADLFVRLQAEYDGACIGTLIAFAEDVNALRANFAEDDRTEQQKIDQLKPIIEDMKEAE